LGDSFGCKNCKLKIVGQHKASCYQLRLKKPSSFYGKALP